MDLSGSLGQAILNTVVYDIRNSAVAEQPPASPEAWAAELGTVIRRFGYPQSVYDDFMKQMQAEGEAQLAYAHPRWPIALTADLSKEKVVITITPLGDDTTD